jgi:hypothetical protein
MTRLMSRRAQSVASLLIDGTFVFALFWPGPVCDWTAPLPSRDSVPSTGRVLWELALAQEHHRAAHGEYAGRVSGLAPLPRGWDIIILEASASSYRMQISNGSETCALWGDGGQPHSVRPFYVNCGLAMPRLTQVESYQRAT